MRMRSNRRQLSRSLHQGERERKAVQQQRRGGVEERKCEPKSGQAAERTATSGMQAPDELLFLDVEGAPRLP